MGDVHEYWYSYECFPCAIFLDVRAKDAEAVGGDKLEVHCPKCQTVLTTDCARSPAIRASEGGFGSNADYEFLLVDAAATLDTLSEEQRVNRRGTFLKRRRRVIRKCVRARSRMRQANLSRFIREEFERVLAEASTEEAMWISMGAYGRAAFESVLKTATKRAARRLKGE